jgi:dATP pyrophosphohydrolase
MSRAPFQILAFPFIIEHGLPLYALFRRNEKTGGYWQGIAGGGEGDESPLEAARREAFEEAGIDPGVHCIALDAMAMLPVVNVCGFLWGEDRLVIPEHAFGMEAVSRSLLISGEHQEYAWHRFEEAMELLKWDSNRTALWELDQRLRRRSMA